MCAKPRKPKDPRIRTVNAPDQPEETAQEVGRSATANKSQAAPNTLGKFDLRLPPSFQIPS